MLKSSLLPLYLSLATGLALPQYYETTPPPTDLRALLTGSNFTWSPETEIWFPEDPEFETEMTQRWNMYAGPTYSAAIRPGSVSDVQQAVRLATSNGAPFMATGGGHGYGTTYRLLQDGLNIDLGHFNSVSVDAEARTLTIGGATLFSEVVDPLYSAGLEIQTGSCACVGMVGATLGAGVGRWQGIHGLIIDALLSVSMVTAAGDLIAASATENPDLFWGLRGAGANFGIVVSATYQAHEMTNDGLATNADFIFPAPSNGSFYAAIEALGELPAELSVFITTVWNATVNDSAIIMNAVYLGPEEDARALLQPFLDLEPATLEIQSIPWSEVTTTANFAANQFFCEDGDFRSIFAQGTRVVSAASHMAMFERMAQFYAEYPGGRVATTLTEIFATQAVLAVPDDETAYPWRDFNAHVMVQMGWTEPEVEEPANQLGVELRDVILVDGGYDELRVYVSYAHGDEGIEQVYGAEKLPRLVELKSEWDPDNVFAFNHALPTSL